MSEVRISIVIVSYNVKELLAECLDSLARFIPETGREIFVVDNDSKDQTLDMIGKDYPYVKLISNNFNAGFPAANNQALKLCKGDYIFLLNPDARLTESIEPLFGFSIAQKDACLVAPRLVYPDGMLQASVQRFITIREVFLEVFYLHHILKKKAGYRLENVTQPFRVEAASGAALFFHKGVMEKIGLLNEKLFWTEDMEYCYRADQHGIPCYYFPDVKVIHHIGSSGAKNPGVMISNQVLSKIRFFLETRGKITGSMVALLRVCHILSRIVLLYPLSLFSVKAGIKARAYFFTLQRFLKSDY